jgi:hypothetical protein
MPAAMTGDTGGSGIGSGPRSLDCRSFWKAGAFEAPSAPAREFHGSSSRHAFIPRNIGVNRAC